MSEILSVIEQIESKVGKVLSQKKILENKVRFLEEENERLKAENALLQKEKTELENKNITVKLTEALEQREDIDELRKRGNELLHRVNKSLALLVSIQDKNRGDE